MTAGPRIAVMISGSGRTLMNLVSAIESGTLDATISLVVASRPCQGADLARKGGLRVNIVEGEIDVVAFDQLMARHQIDWVVLGGYLHLIHIPDRLRGRIVNIHPALLPDFGGPGMYGARVHQAVLDSGATRSGCTVHLCDEEFDHGPVLAQSECPVVPGDSPQTLAARVFEQECHLYPRALADLFARRAKPQTPRVRIGEG